MNNYARKYLKFILLYLFKSRKLTIPFLSINSKNVNGNIKSNKNGKVKSAQFLLLFFNLVYLFYGKNCHKGGTK